jgi:hypothetical protein
MKARFSTAMALIVITIGGIPAIQAAGSQTKKGEEGPDYYRVIDSKVDPSTFLGWEVFHSACFACHGVGATGTDVAPDLVERVKHLGPEEFAIKVLTRYRITMPLGEATAEDRTAVREAIIAEVMKHERGKRGELVMPAWETNPKIKPHILDLYAYLKARADGAMGPGRPEFAP